MANIEKRITQSGKISFRVKVRLKGFPTQTEASLLEGRHFKTTEAKRHTLTEVIDRYIRKILPTKPKSGFSQIGQLQWWKRTLGTCTLSEITPGFISRIAR